ncbi:C10 family peptidase [Pedobacter insulae]|uniref:Peptidase C10 family protein n=1 Tax=Pedobacter insulae TaxID=414048 RepID=A0A1I2W3M4_9SPHI|nr:C10 family peptidase [Pedobacter insulae]SFG95249.1 Peptidase C10 family protein [Pedobacter insulae]
MRSRNKPQAESVKSDWDQVFMKGELSLGKTIAINSLPECDEEGEQYTETLINGPLMGTTWGQGDGYNANTPYMNCSSYINGNAPTGCVATAMGQVMNYYQQPSNWSWSPSGAYSSSTNTLLSVLGNQLGMNYGCGGSGALMSNFDNVFGALGYSTANYHSYYNASVVESDLLNSKPVIIGAGQNWANPFSGHTWVIEGVWKIGYYICHLGEGPFPGAMCKAGDYQADLPDIGPKLQAI